MFSIFAIYACTAFGTPKQECDWHTPTDVMPWVQCMSGPTGQVMVEKYVREHPKHKVIRYACIDPKRFQAYRGRTQA